MSLTPAIAAYRWLLTPIPPFTWIDAPISTLDVAAALRLCLVLRQLREAARAEHRAAHPGATVEPRSFVKDAVTVLTVVYGGEAIIAPWLGATPSFMASPLVPALYTALTAAIERLPRVPRMTLELELPLALFDGFSRAYLLCQLIPPLVTTLAAPPLARSPWTLLLSSLLVANGGFFLTNTFSMLHPAGWAAATPPELRARGWTTADLWCAPAATGLFALLTHAQPFWADAHALLAAWLRGGSGAAAKPPAPLNAETARALCAVLLAALFAGRAVRNFGGEYRARRRGEKGGVPSEKDALKEAKSQ